VRRSVYSVIIKPDVAEANRPTPKYDPVTGSPEPKGADGDGRNPKKPSEDTPGATGDKKLPTRFIGTVMISADRPAREIHQVVEAIVEQLTTLPGSDVSLKLEIDAENH
jgi:hypothetical protein